MKLLQLATLALTVPALIPVVAQAKASQAAAEAPAPKAAAQAVRVVRFQADAPAAQGTLVLPLAAESDLAQRAPSLSAPAREAVARALTAASFRYSASETLSLRGIDAWNRIVIVGLGEKPGPADFQNAGVRAGRALISEKGPLQVLAGGLAADQAAEFATGLGIGEYRSDLYTTRSRPLSASEPVTVTLPDSKAAGDWYAQRGTPMIGAMAWARDIANEPANVVYPESFVARARAAFAGLRGVTIEVLDPAAMKTLGMGALLGVGQGSERGPRLLVVRYQGAGAPSHGPVVLAGKGITFDSGGISIKPSANMGDMKFDMAGAASVTGAALSLARSGAPVDVVAISALAENMPDGHAIRPGDVLQAMNGKTIEIITTDAEGRLVLADALSWIDTKLKPAAVVDVATLTGAIVTALGDDYAGLFTRHEALARQIDTAAVATGESVWRMPLHASHGKDIESTIADVKNSGGSGAGAGASLGAYFIGEFIGRQVPWAHIDIAGVAWKGSANDSSPAGATGWGVRLLDRFVRDFAAVPPGE